MTLEDSATSFNHKAGSGATSVSGLNSHMVSQVALDFLRGADNNSNHEGSKHLLILDKFKNGGEEEKHDQPHSESSTESVNEDDDVQIAAEMTQKTIHRPIGSSIIAGS
jgi:hypothetical protein